MTNLKRCYGEIYVFLQEISLELMEVVHSEVRREMWFQHNGALVHCTHAVSEYLDENFGKGRVGRGDK
jgi:hypothetical protein